MVQNDTGATEQPAPSMPRDLRWMATDTERVRVRPEPGKHGLRLGALNVGKYGEIPERWPYESLLPRGAVPPLARTPSLGYTIFDKAELWADSAADLYEEGIQRRWVPALDVDWGALRPLPDEVEHAICQICTDLGEQALVRSRLIGSWLPEMSYGFHEVKLILGQECFDLARQFEALRKRTFANGGGPGVEAAARYVKGIFDTPEWVSVNFGLHVLGPAFTLHEFASLEWAAPHATEKRMFRFMMEDIARHARYGGENMRLLLQMQPERSDELVAYAAAAEQHMVREIEANKYLEEAYILLFGHKAGSLAGGRDAVARMRERQVRSYQNRLEWIGIGASPNYAMMPELSQFMTAGAATA